MHSAFIGMGPAADYTPFTLNDDTTRGGYARLAGLIAKKKEERKDQGPVLVLDAGDYSMGTAFAAASRETGGELQLMSLMSYDATTFGNHDFDLGPDGLGKAIGVARKAGRVPAVLASNTNLAGSDATLADLQRLARDGVIRRHLVIERGGLRFGIFGLLGKEAQFYTTGAGAVTFSDAIETAKEMVKVLRETEKVDVVICLSHGGLEKGQDGRYSDGDDVRMARAVPGIDVVIGGHSHTELHEAIIVNDRTPVVQTGFEGRNLGELVVTLDGGKLTVASYRLHPIDDTVAGDRAIADEIDTLKKTVTAAVFASRGYSIDQPLAVAPQDLPNTFTDIAAGTPLANLCTDAFRKATQADIGFSMAGNVWEWTCDWFVLRHADEVVKSCCGPAVNPRIVSPEKSYNPRQPQFPIPRKAVKGGSHLCAPNYCLCYRPAARQPQMIDTGMSHIGFRCIVRKAESA